MSPAEGRGPFGGIGHAFGDRNFRVFSVGSIASWTSFFVQIVAVSWLTWELTGSTLWLAVIASLDIVPNVLLTPFTGALADRFDRYRIWMITNLLLLLQATAVAVLAWIGLLTIWPLALLVLLHGVLISFTVPVMHGTLPRFVERSRLSSAIAVNSSYSQFAFFAGPALAGWIIVAYGIEVAFAVNALGYGVLLCAAALLKSPEGYSRPQASSRSMCGDIVDGIAYIRGHQGISALLLLMLAGDAVAAGFYYMLPAYSEQVLGMGVLGLSTILASRGAGAAIAALWLAHGGAKAVKVERILWSFLLALLAIAALVLVANLYLAVGAAIVLGLASETRKTGTMSLIQLSVKEAQRGRVMGNMFGLSQLAAGLGTYVIGALAVTRGLAEPLLVAASLSAIVWLAFFVRRRELALCFRGIAGH